MAAGLAQYGRTGRTGTPATAAGPSLSDQCHPPVTTAPEHFMQIFHDPMRQPSGRLRLAPGQSPAAKRPLSQRYSGTVSVSTAT
jgi:hypothetical protein